MNSASRSEPQLSGEELDRKWRDEVYVADGSPQLTLRSTLTGVVLGCLLALSNLYAGLKTGWSFSIAITACILSFSFWRLLMVAKPGSRSPEILEDNCMQSTASAAGYTIVALLVSAIPAYLMVTGVRIRAGWLMLWVFFSAALGLMLFIPFKRQLVNDESLVFPSGVAAAETLRGLHAKDGESLRHARGLFSGMGLGALGSWLGTNNAFSLVASPQDSRNRIRARFDLGGLAFAADGRPGSGRRVFGGWSPHRDPNFPVDARRVDGDLPGDCSLAGVESLHRG